jgi:TfoX/Sxy family transcriptional regulator of competence genes
MAFSEALAGRSRQRLARRKNVEEKKMFGGVGFLLNGNLLVGVRKDSLLVRVGPEQSDEALPHDWTRTAGDRMRPEKRAYFFEHH